MRSNPFGLANKSILITGASSGIGKAIALACAQMGATLYISGRNREKLQQVYAALEGKDHVQIPADLTDESDLLHLIEELPPLDGMVHCAGVVHTLPFKFISREKLNNIFEINFTAPTLLSKELLKKGKINKAGSIVWISSVSGTICSFPGNAMYSATKAAITGMLKGMALELAPQQIRVNAVLPGQIETDIIAEGSISREQLELEMKKYPLKRFGKPEEVAHAVIYLLSDASRWVTGSNLLIDGGYTLQ